MYGTVEAMPTDVSSGGCVNGRIGTAEEGRGIGVELYVSSTMSSVVVIGGAESICMVFSLFLFFF
jgi:hypothetical protein